MLYTGKGDKGKTGLYCCQQKVSKHSAVIEALGAVDEINSLLGVVKMVVGKNKKTAKIIHEAQEDLFIIQAELAGAGKKLGKEKVEKLEKIIAGVEEELPPIKSFSISGGTEAAAQLDYARAVARRAERRVVAAAKKQKIGAPTLAYLNRLSSLLYALARLTNHKFGIEEAKPKY